MAELTNEQKQLQLALVDDYGYALTNLANAVQKNPTLAKFITLPDLKPLVTMQAACTTADGTQLTPEAGQNLTKIRDGLDGINKKIAEALGSEEADKLLKESYGEKFDYTAKVGPLPGFADKIAKKFDKLKNKLDLENFDKHPVQTIFEAGLLIAGGKFLWDLLTSKGIADKGWALLGLAIAAFVFTKTDILGNVKGTAKTQDNNNPEVPDALEPPELRPVGQNQKHPTIKKAQLAIVHQ